MRSITRKPGIISCNILEVMELANPHSLPFSVLKEKFGLNRVSACSYICLGLSPHWSSLLYTGLKDSPQVVLKPSSRLTVESCA